MLIPNHPNDERLSALASGDPEAVADSALSEHVASCLRCTDTVAELGALRAALAEMPDLQPHRPLQLLPPVRRRAGSCRSRRWLGTPVLRSDADRRGRAGDRRSGGHREPAPRRIWPASGASRLGWSRSRAEAAASACRCKRGQRLRRDVGGRRGERRRGAWRARAAPVRGGRRAGRRHRRRAERLVLADDRPVWPMLLFAGVAIMIAARAPPLDPGASRRLSLYSPAILPATTAPSSSSTISAPASSAAHPESLNVGWRRHGARRTSRAGDRDLTGLTHRARRSARVGGGGAPRRPGPGRRGRRHRSDRRAVRGPVARGRRGGRRPGDRVVVIELAPAPGVREDRPGIVDQAHLLRGRRDGIGAREGRGGGASRAAGERAPPAAASRRATRPGSRMDRGSGGPASGRFYGGPGAGIGLD